MMRVVLRKKPRNTGVTMMFTVCGVRMKLGFEGERERDVGLYSIRKTAA